ncbi:MAG: RNA polymerase-binding protein RbpA [Actinomycetota bacterium]|nr:RNA polymerase-binding protein RbpA [Actinomycetota bacterium]
MADRILRGSRLGAVSYETEYGAEPAPRNIAAYRCPRGHEFAVPFSEEAEIPSAWECRLDGTTAVLIDGPEPEAKKVKPPRTHWDMLMERRTIADLEEVLAERLDVLRARRGQKSA